MFFQFGPRAAIIKIPNALIEQPNDLILLTTKEPKLAKPQQFIAISCLNSLNLSFKSYAYQQTQVCFGELPVLIIKNKVFHRYEIMDALSTIEYNEHDFFKNQRSRAFVRDISNKFRKILRYYKNFDKAFGGVGHMDPKQVEKDCIQLFQMLQQALRADTFQLHRPRVDVVPLVDIAVYYYIEFCLKELQNTQADYLLRSYYWRLLEWKNGNAHRISQYLSRKGDVEPRMILWDLELVPQAEEPRPKVNVNWSRGLISFGLLGLIYALFT